MHYKTGWSDLKKYWFHIALMICIILPIALLCVFDYYNIEGYNYRYDEATNSFEKWDNIYLNENFSFDVTWKGRMFYLFFAWFLVIETAFSWNEIIEKKPKNRYVTIAALIFAIVPTIYVLATNFLGLDVAVLSYGQSLNIPFINTSNTPSDFLHLFWPLSVEYLVFFIFFAIAIMVAYKPKALKTFSISLALLGGIGIAYTLDTVFPFGVLRPLQEIALPLTATTAALFDILGYNVRLIYPSASGGEPLPGLTVVSGGQSASVSVAWACAGVYSLLLYILIILVFFRRINISSFRKVLYFFIGLIGTFFSSVLRIFSIVLVYLQQGREEAMIFHDSYGELYGFTWIFLFIIIIVCIERFMLVERTKAGINKINTYLGNTKDKLISKLKKGNAPAG